MSAKAGTGADPQAPTVTGRTCGRRYARRVLEGGDEDVPREVSAVTVPANRGGPVPVPESADDCGVPSTTTDGLNSDGAEGGPER